MKYKASLFKGKWLKALCVGLLSVFCLVAISACGTSRGTVHVYDQANVLDDARVSDSVNFPYTFDVYTTNTFDGDKPGFQSTTVSKLQGDANRVVLAIDTRHHYVYLARGGKVPLSSSGINQAVNSFTSNYRSGDYTGATVAAVNSIGNSVGSGSNGLGGVPGTLLCVGLIALALILLAFGVFRRRSSGGWGGRQGYVPPTPYNNNPGYGPGYGQQGPYYGQQGGGMNPWAAGGLGAAAGGLIGYELGRQAGEHESGGQSNDWAGGGGSFGEEGSFGGGDFGGGGGDFGGGGGDFGGGGGDFGGGGGDF